MDAHVNTSKCYKQVNNVLHTPPIGENGQPLHIGNFSITMQDILGEIVDKDGLKIFVKVLPPP
jgi:hypothetical protein